MKPTVRLVFAIALLLLAHPGPAAAKHFGGPVCGSQPGDADAIAAARTAAAGSCDCAGTRSHGRYVFCVAQAVKDIVHGGSLRRQCSETVIRCARRSTCGRPGFVTCCRTDAAGATECSVTRSADRCRAPAGGSACVGSVPSCCDACAGGECAGTTTTTGIPTTTTTPETTTTSAPETTTTTEASTTTTIGASTTTTTGGATTTTGGVTTTTGASSTTTTITTGTSTTTTMMQACAPIVVGQPIAGTYKLQGTTGELRCTTNSSTNRFGPCTTDANCGGTAGSCLQLPWVTADGQVMSFPTGTSTVFTVATAASFPACEHQTCIPCGNPHAACAGIPGCEVTGNPNGCVPRGTQGCCDQPGFIVPTFFVNILGGLCSRVDQVDCGLGVINTSNPQTGDNEVTKTADTSDPGADCVYGTSDDCASPGCKACTVAGQGNDYAGKIVSTIGNGSADANGIQYRLTTPELSTTWSDSQSPTGSCTQGSTYDDGELLVSQLILKAQPTTAGATGKFMDLNADACSRAGQGFISATNASTDGPITVGPSPGPLKPQPYNGSSGSVSGAVSEVFSGPNSPIKDIGFVAITPQMPITTAPAVTCSCTVTPSCPE